MTISCLFFNCLLKGDSMKAFYLVVVIAALIATFVAVDAFNNNNRGCLNAYDHIDVIIAEGCDQ